MPGAAFSPLSDAELANVLNWLLRTFSPAQLPTGFQPYTESEVAAARPHRYDDVVPVRHGLARELAALGLALSDYSYGSARAPLRPGVAWGHERAMGDLASPRRGCHRYSAPGAR